MPTVIEKVLFLQNVDVFGEVPTEQLSHLAAIAQAVSVAAGQRVYQQSDPSDALYIVMTGKIELQQGDKPVVALEPEESFGIWALFDIQPRMFTAVAAEPSELLRIDREDFVDLLSDHVSISQAVIQRLAAKLRGLAERVASAGPV